MQNINTFKLFERISTIIRSEERKKYATVGLQPIHGQVLEYLSICNSFSDTLVSVAEYLNLTKGTVSQTIQLLQRKGFIEKQQDKEDRRVTHLKLLPLGQSILDEFSSVDLLEQAGFDVPAIHSSLLTDVLKNTITSLQRTSKARTFGKCDSCKYFGEQENYYHCGGSDHIVYSAEINKICREHLPNPA